MVARVEVTEREEFWEAAKSVVDNFFVGMEEIVASIPDKPEEIFDEFLQDIQLAYGDDLISVILYGSGAKGEYVPKKSDINFLVVLTASGIEQLEKALEFIPKWNKRGVAVPLFLTKSYIAAALDAYPIEFLDMKTHNRLVHGEDVLSALQMDKTHLRLQAERELRGKLLSLRQGFLSTGQDRDRLRAMLGATISTFVAIFEALLFLKGEVIPKSKAEVIEKTAHTFGIEKSTLVQILNIKSGQWHGSRVQLLQIAKNYIKEIRKLIDIVDKM